MGNSGLRSYRDLPSRLRKGFQDLLVTATGSGSAGREVTTCGAGRSCVVGADGVTTGWTDATTAGAFTGTSGDVGTDATTGCVITGVSFMGLEVVSEGVSIVWKGASSRWGADTFGWTGRGS